MPSILKYAVMYPPHPPPLDRLIIENRRCLLSTAGFEVNPRPDKVIPCELRKYRKRDAGGSIDPDIRHPVLTFSLYLCIDNLSSIIIMEKCH